jgi:hypothetical protein
MKGLEFYLTASFTFHFTFICVSQLVLHTHDNLTWSAYASAQGMVDHIAWGKTQGGERTLSVEPFANTASMVLDLYVPLTLAGVFKKGQVSSIHIHIHIHIHILIHTSYIYTYTYIYIIHTAVYSLHIHTHTHIHITHIHIQIHTRIYFYTYTYTYAYPHTHKYQLGTQLNTAT